MIYKAFLGCRFLQNWWFRYFLHNFLFLVSGFFCIKFELKFIYRAAPANYLSASKPLGSVSDLDPVWIQIQSGQWIRIPIRNPDSDPGGKKRPTKVERIRNLMFWSAGSSLLRAEGLFCNLDVLKGTQDWEFFWLRYLNLWYFFFSYVKILRFSKKNFLIGPLLGEIRFFRLVWD